jgi:hypothetical protein
MQRLMGASAPGRDDETGRPGDVRGQQREERERREQRRADERGEAIHRIKTGAGACSSKSAETSVQSSRVGTWSRRRAGAIGLRQDRGQRWEGTLEGLRVAGCGQNKRKA